MNHKSNKINKFLLEQESALNNSLEEKWWPFKKRREAADDKEERREEEAAAEEAAAEEEGPEDSPRIDGRPQRLEQPVRNVPNKELNRSERKDLEKRKVQTVNAVHAAAQTIVKTLICSHLVCCSIPTMHSDVSDDCIFSSSTIWSMPSKRLFL